MRKALLGLLVVACGGGASTVHDPQNTTTTTTSPSTSSIASTTPTASTATPPTDQRGAPPDNFRLLAGEGYSIFVPTAWRPLQAAPGAQALASSGGADDGMSLQVVRVAFTGPETEFVAGVSKGVVGSGGVQTSTSTIAISGRQVPISAFTVSKPGPAIRGVIRAQAGADHIVTITCHTAEPSWNDKARQACDPVFASFHVGASTAMPAAPNGKRWLSGSDWRAAIPAAWTDDVPHTAEVHALARSSNDEHTMVVITVAEVATDAKPEPKTRDAMLAKLGGLILAKEGTHGSIKRAGPNVIDLDFTRQLEGQVTALINAHFFATDAGFLVTCGGLRSTMEAHHDICETAIRSMRLEHLK